MSWWRSAARGALAPFYYAGFFAGSGWRTAVQTTHPRDPVLAEWFGGGTTAAGVAVTPETAMRTATVYACIRVRASVLASLPLILYHRLGPHERERAIGHPLAILLGRRPNRWQTRMQFVEMGEAHLMLRGNFIAEKRFDNRGRLDQLVPLHPDRVRILQRPDMSLAYEHQPPTGPRRILLADEVFHVAGLTLDGFRGVSPVTYQRETIGLAMAQADYASRFFANDVSAGLMLKSPPGFKFASAEDRDRYLKALRDQRTGKNRFMPTVLEFGLEPENVTMSNEDAQFIESRRLSRAEICGIYGVPLTFVGDDQKQPRANMEQETLNFQVMSLGSSIARWEGAIGRDVIGDDRADALFAEFLLDGLLRGDVKTRFAAYRASVGGPFMTPNEARRREGLDDQDWGELPYPPSNMTREAGASDDEGEDDDEAPGRPAGGARLNGHTLPN